MTRNIGEHAVNILKTDYHREYAYSATAGVNVSKGWVYADSEEQAADHIRMMLTPGVFEVGNYVVTMKAARPIGFWYSAEPKDGSDLPTIKSTHIWEPRPDRARVLIEQAVAQGVKA